MKIPFAGPWITDLEVKYVTDAVKTGWYMKMEDYTKKFEKAMAKYIGSKYVLASFCATHSLHLGCKVLFEKGDEVIVPDISWIATAAVISYVGATPVFVDVDDYWNIDPNAIEKAITKKTKGIMLVHMFGMPCDMDTIMRIAKKHNLKVIEDAAPALGSLYKGKKMGGFGDVGCFSFQGAKIAVSGEGGIFLSDNKKLYEKAKLYGSMYRTDRKAQFWCDDLGFEYPIANMVSACGLAQVERIEELVKNKRKIFNWYYERLNAYPQIRIIKEPSNYRCNYCWVSIEVENIKGKTLSTRDHILQELRKKNVGARALFPRMSRFPMYKERFTNPRARLAEKQGINLPSAHNLTEDQVDYVCKIITKSI